MLVKEKIGNLSTIDTGNKTIDWLNLEWYETGKRIMHKRSQSGVEVIMKFLNENQNLTQGDVLYQDSESVIAINIQPCEVLIIRPQNMYQMACICYEIGNKHLPLFYEDEEVLVAYDAPLFRLIASSGYQVEKGERKLISPLKTTVAAHGHSGNGETLFSKIMRLTNPQE
ncbi:urease accessory protein UreE [Mucilaginibacter paludis]|uniref:Urease accessory protein UreE n=1 Tax=Mucilaginibacter paludis DSM 18603 TaxID=714943 RepID=H1Y7Y2_9SPHI|nr:urease accessory protein UreE [Mucilaginibacter paludis]EHQ30468.1 Urease accessory protein ureE [Mucilaginibacter paludis DSM 18603]